MELKSYLLILWRRWPAVVIVPALVIVLAVWQDTSRDVTYSTTVSAAVIRQRDPLPPGQYAYDDYYNYVASEYAIDDLVEAVRGNVFAQAVAQRLQAQGIAVDAGEVQSDLSADRKQRVLSMRVSSPDPGRAKAIALAATDELEQSSYSYIGVATDATGSNVRVIQRPGDASPDVQRARLLLALEVIAAVGFGVLLAFFVHYIDDTLYDAETTANALRLPHLASVPAESRR